jgi:hydrogenase maturation protein HypF
MMNDESQVDDSPFPIHHSSFPIHHSSFPIHHSQLIPVQHHHAHLAACLAENGMAGPALGVTWDGTGYGTDGTVWGGEFLLGDAAGYQRVAHLRAFRLPGGDAAIKEPRRIAFAMLWELYGDGVVEMDHLAPVRALSLPERRVLAQMLRRGLNAPLTTSAGRLFDGVASLLGLQQQVSFEGQAAMALEFTADPRETGHYEFVVEPRRSSGSTKSNSGELPQSPPSSSELPRTPTSSAKLRQALPHSPLVLDWAPLVEAVLADLQQGITSGIMASRFHNALVEAIVTVARQVGQPQVALTGGCFQNRLLCQGSVGRLRQEGFQVLMHRLVPPNDGGISLGQIAVATAQLAAG